MLFDLFKMYIFNNNSIKNLIFNSEYIQTFQQIDNNIIFSKTIIKFDY